MYRREKNFWQKHMDFMILDVLCVQFSYILAFMLRHGLKMPYSTPEYRNMGVIIALVQICIAFFLENHKNIVRRGYFEEFKKTFLLSTTLTMTVLAYLFITQTSKFYSRAVFLQMWAIEIVVIFCVRLVRKSFLRKNLENTVKLQKMIVISSLQNAKKTISVLNAKKYQGFYIGGIILVDFEDEIYSILDIPVLGMVNQAEEILQQEFVDEIFIDLPPQLELTHEILESCEEMGITTHMNLGVADEQSENITVENYAGHMVLTTSLKFAESRQLLLKRIMDIAGGIVGILLTLIITIIFGPIIYFQSPGPVFFSQKRVGRNGRKFKIYKFRSMYLDAEERKKELMEQNKMQGFMFKMDNDPRIIPIGKFMRKMSLDEFPQFFNVLKGDMSLVGTRPPTLDEYEQYEKHHKARLAAKPGLTGMWQVSGRSDIVDFEEVVALDKKYIQEWNIGLDMRILFQTVKSVLTGKGSV